MFLIAETEGKSKQNLKIYKKEVRTLIDLEINTQKSKNMMLSTNKKKNRICVHDEVVKQASNFKYLGASI